MTRKKTTKEFKEELKNKGIYTFEILGEYEGRHKKIKVRCIDKGHEFMMEPASISSGHGCRYCAGNFKRDTPYVQGEIDKIYGEGHLVIKSKYTGNYDKMTIECSEHHNSFERTRAELIRNMGCPKEGPDLVSRLNNYTTETFQAKLNEIDPDRFEVLEDYKGYQERIIVRDNQLDIEGKVTPAALLRGGSIGTTNVKYTNEDVQAIIDKRWGKGKYILVSDYVDKHTRFKVRCTIHDIVFDKYLYQLQRNGTCPICVRDNMRESRVYNGGESKGEKAIREYLDSNSIDYISQQVFPGCRSVDLLPFDFYVEDKVLIEFQGVQHYQYVSLFFKTEQDFEEQKKRDKIKRDWDRDNNIPLLAIPYGELPRIDEYLDGYLLPLLNK